MIKYILRRIFIMIPILLGVIIVVFTINYCSTGSPAIVILGNAATPENVAKVEHDWGLDRPYLIQLGDYIKNLVTKADLGTSYVFKRPVAQMISERLGVTVTLGLLSIAFSVVVGIPLGILSATKQYSIFDYASTIFAVIIAAIPSFWLASLLMLLFSVKLGWLPISGLGTPAHWILPVVSVGAFPVAMITRMTRSSMLEVIRQDYIRTAKAKGLPSGIVIFKHALKNGMIPVSTAIGIMAGLSMTGTIIIETIFNIPGLGTLMNTAISKDDYILTQGIVLVCAIIICGVNLLTDILYAFLDPRIKAQYTDSTRKKKSQKVKV
jgi:peptide/nickel transport system permease protein